MEERGNKARAWKLLAVAGVACLMSALATTVVRTNSGKTDISTVKFISSSGYTLAADVFRPRTATKENPAPVILIEHGGNVNKERLEMYGIEFSRRGYLAIIVDMYCHGQSEALPDSKWLTAGRGLYDGLRYAMTLPFADKGRVGFLGTSRGGKAASESLLIDDAEGNVVKAVFLVHSDPIYKNSSGFVDVYGPRDVGVIADKNDEFFFSEKKDDAGVYSNDANKYAQILTSPRDYVSNKSAQSFLNFGQDPSDLPARSAETVYKKDFGGKVGTRAIYVTNEVHQAGDFSPLIMRKSLDFFESVIPAPVKLASTDFAFTANFAFSLLGILGLFLFLFSFAFYLVKETRFFSRADTGTPELAVYAGKANAAWFWGGQVVSVVGTILIITLLNKLKLSAYWDSLFRTANAVYYGLICLLSGALGLVVSVAWYRLYGKKNGFGVRASGLLSPAGTVAITALAALVATLALYLLVFATGYLFSTDYIFIQWGFMPFGANRIPGMLIALPLFVVGFTAMSVSINCFNFSAVFGKNKLVNNLILSFLMTLPTLFIIAWVFGNLIFAGRNPMIGGLRSAATALAPFPPMTFMLVFISRKLYEKTGNPYLGGFISGIVSSVFVWAVCEIRVPEAGTFIAPKPVFLTALAVGFAAVIACAIYFGRSGRREEAK